MIDPKTLYIGSHVMVDGVRARVIRIDEPKDEHEIPPCTLLRFKTLSDGKWYDCGGPADSGKVEPIPITAELLTELGFHEVKDTYFSDWHKGWLKITNNTGQAHPWWVYNGFIKLYYLHQLENLYYLMNKEELIKE